MGIRISVDKNLAFKDQPTPLLGKQVKDVIKQEEADRTLEAPLEFSRFLVARQTPQVEAGVHRVRQADRPGNYEIRLTAKNTVIGQHAFPPSIRALEQKPLGNRSKEFQAPLEVAGHRPSHLALHLEPSIVPEDLRIPPYMRPFVSIEKQERGNQATTIFAPDNRYTFFDTSYPWCTCGRVDTPLGQASGVMVGSRHLLTVSHTLQWNADGTAGWIRFRPSFFDGSAPFGEAWGTLVYFKQKVTGPTIDWIEGMYDYVCVVLDRRIGDWTGWMGARGYTDAWDGGAYWSHIGYPGDLAAGNRPSYQGGIALDGAWWQFDSHEAMDHRGDVWPGQSGGPFFGWWAGEVGPRAVATQSAQNPSENKASGGQDLVDLIIRARNDNP